MLSRSGGGGDRRSSGRLRALGQKYKVSSETRTDIQTEKRNARIEFLEDDNFVRAKELKEDDEFVPEDDESALFSSRKRKAKSRKRTADRIRRNKLTSFSSVMENESFDAYPAHVPTFVSVVSQPSKYPPRQFCSVCGYFSNYTCTRCGMRFCSTKCNTTHQDTRCLKWVSS